MWRTSFEPNRRVAAYLPRIHTAVDKVNASMRIISLPSAGNGLVSTKVREGISGRKYCRGIDGCTIATKTFV